MMKVSAPPSITIESNYGSQGYTSKITETYPDSTVKVTYNSFEYPSGENEASGLVRTLHSANNTSDVIFSSRPSGANALTAPAVPPALTWGDAVGLATLGGVLYVNHLAVNYLCDSVGSTDARLASTVVCVPLSCLISKLVAVGGGVIMGLATGLNAHNNNSSLTDQQFNRIVNANINSFHNKYTNILTPYAMALSTYNLVFK